MPQPKNPWKDFASYESTDARYFKGREESIAKFMRILDSGTMSVLYASSGIGKTSFLQAGIEPLLQNRGYAPIHILFTDDDFAPNMDLGIILGLRIIDEVKKYNNKEKKKAEDKNSYIANTWEWCCLLDQQSEEAVKNLSQHLETQSLWWKLHAYELRDTNGQCLKPLIIFDQFEEVFVKSKAQRDYLQTLFTTLEELASNNLPTKVEKKLEQLAVQDIFLDLNTQHRYKIIFSLRKEYLSDFDYWTNDRHAIPELLQNRMLLLPFSRKQATKVICEQPADEEELSYIETLTPIADNILQMIDDNNHDEVEPFILSVLCCRLFDRAIQAGKNQLNKSDLASYSTHTIIREFYEQKVKSIIQKHRHLRIFEDILVDDDGKRNRIKVKLLNSIHFSRLYQEPLEDAHLVRIDKYNNDEYIELVHDRVADAIMKRREERKKQSTKKYKIILISLGMLLLLGYTVYEAMFSQNFSLRQYTYIKSGTSLTIRRPKEKQKRIYQNYDFSHEPNIKEVCFSDTIMGLFKKCDNLEKVEIKTNGTIPAGMFLGCPSLRKLIVSEDVLLSVEDSAFQNCKYLEEIKANFCKIDDYSFANCPDLHQFTIGDSTSYISSRAFLGSHHINFIINEGNNRFVFDKGFLIDKENNDVLYIRIDTLSEDKQVLMTFSDVIKDKSTIEFDGITFKNIKEQDTIRRISHEHFINNYKLGDKDQVKVLDLSRCDSVPVYIYDCAQLHTIILPKYLRNISIRNCPQLDSINLSNCEFIGTNISLDFTGCSNLTKVLLPEKAEQITNVDFSECENLSEIDIHACGIKNLWESFTNCTHLQKVILPDSLCLLYNTFENCIELCNIDLPNTLEKIGFQSFMGCISLKEILLPSQLSTIGDKAFTGSGIQQIVLPETMKALYLSAFTNIKTLQEIHLPDTVENINGDLYFGENVKIICSPESCFKEDDNGYLWFGKSTIVGCGKVKWHDMVFPDTIRVMKGYSSSQALISINGMLWDNEKKELLHIPKNIRKAHIPNDYCLYTVIDSTTLAQFDFSKSDVYQSDGKYVFPQFTSDHNIYCIHEDSVMNIPPSPLYYPVYSINYKPHLLREIHIPFTSPRSFWLLGLNYTDEKLITLYVPAGAKEKFIASGLFSNFKDIREDTQWRQIYNISAYTMRCMIVFFFWHPIMFSIFVICSILLVIAIIYVYNRYTKETITWQDIPRKLFIGISLLMAAIICFGIIYYLLWLVYNVESKWLLRTIPTLFVIILFLLCAVWVGDNSIYDIGRLFRNFGLGCLDIYDSMQNHIEKMFRKDVK